jgi:hypothetical protein
MVSQQAAQKSLGDKLSASLVARGGGVMPVGAGLRYGLTFGMNGDPLRDRI